VLLALAPLPGGSWRSPVSSSSTLQRQLPTMGCGNSTATAPIQAQAIQPKGTVEEQAVAQLKLLFESIDTDSDRTVDKNELQMAFQKNDQLGALIAEAGLNPDSLVLEQLDMNKDGRVSWEEFESHLKKPATEQVATTGHVVAAEATVEEKAKARLREVFNSIDSNKDGVASKEELKTKLGSEDEGFKTLLVEAGLQTNFEVLEQLDGDSDKRVTWDDFYGKLKEAAKAEIKATADVAAATEIKIEGAGTGMLICCM